MPVGVDFRDLLDPGTLRHRIRWERKMPTNAGQNTFGEVGEEWTLVAQVSAHLVPLQGRELDAARQRWTEAQYRIRQHYVRGMDTAERGVVKIEGVDRYLDPVSIEDENGMGRVQRIIAKEWVGPIGQLATEGGAV